MYLGAFLTAFSLMFLEILATRVLGIVQGPETVVYIVAVAMLGMGAAGSLLSVLPTSGSPIRCGRQAALACILAGLGVLFLFGASTAVKGAMNQGMEAALSSGGLAGLVGQLSGGRLAAVALLGAILAVPYFFFGVALALIFRGTEASLRSRVYAADLSGASLGCYLALGALEGSGFHLPLSFALVLPFLAAAALLRRQRGRLVLAPLVLGIFAAILPWIPGASERLEPQPHLGTLARLDADHIVKAEELWHTWDSYARVGALRRVDRDGTVDWRMTLGEGEGHALVRPYRGGDQDPDPAFLPGELALSCGQPAKLLVLFAGAGQDLVAIDELCRGGADLTGVELNRHMMAWPRTRPEFRLDEFLARPQIHYHVSEAREFLERDSARYDSILLSWSGATLAYYNGAAGFGPRYVYTREGLEAILDHLTPKGQVTILNTNKVRTLATLRLIMEARGLKARNAVAVLGRPSPAYAWNGAWDQNRMVIKPSGLSEQDLTRLAAVAAKHRLQFIYDPRDADPHPHPFGKVLRERNLDKTLHELSVQSGLDFTPRDDNHPFVLDVFPPSAYLSRGFWTRHYPKILPASFLAGVRPQWDQRRHNVQALFLFALAGLALILGPPLLFRRRFFDRKTRRHHILVFGALGSGFMLVEIGLVQMLGLFLGHPGRALGVVLGALVLWGGSGSFASGYLFRRRILGFRSGVALVILSNLALLLVIHVYKEAILGSDLPTKVALVTGLLALPGFFMGQLFPQALARIPTADSGPLPWALAINGLASTLAASAALLIGQLFGFQGVIICGLACYLVVAFGRHDAARFAR